jgi:hypothetical protein
MKLLLGLCHRIAYATTFALAGLLLAVMPLGLKLDPTGVTTHVLNLPVAAVGLILPDEWQGIDLWFSQQEWGYLHFSETLIRHLRLAIPVYVLLFYVPSLFRGAVKWGRGRRRRHDEPVGSSPVC